MTFFQKPSPHNPNDISPIRHFAAKENRQILLRYTCIYIAYLLVLSVVLMSVINVSGNLMERKTILLAEEIISSGIEELEITLDAYERAASTLMESRELQRIVSGASDSMYDAVNAHQYFKAVTQSLESLPNCGYYLRNGDLIVPAAYILTPKNYFTEQMNCIDFPDYESWHTYIRSVPGSFAPAMTYINYIEEEETNAILYLVRKGTADRQELFYVMIPIDHITQLLAPSPQSTFGNMTLSVPYGDEPLILYQSEPFPSKDCLHTITYTGSFGLTVTMDISSSYIEAELEEAWIGFYMFTVIFILIGLFFAIVMAYHNTRPIAVLLKAATQYDTTGQFNTPTKRINKEYKYILSILSNSSAALKSYEKELERFASETQYWSFVGMLMGEETDMAMSLHRPPYGLLLLAPESANYETCSLLMTLIRNHTDKAISRAGFLCVFRNAVIILAEESRFEKLESGITELLDTLPDLQCRQLSVMGLKTVTEIHDAYSQAICMLTLPPTDSTLRQDVKLVSRSDAADAIEHFTQFDVSTIAGLLTSGQIDTLTGMFDNCITFFRSGGYADETSVYYIYATCALSLTVIRSKFADITADITLPEFSAFSSAEHLLKSLRGIMIEAHERIRSSYQKSNITERDEIMEYIAENIGNPELYSKMVMEKFGLTTRELQNHVKKATGTSFFHCVEQLRMDRAKHLLLTTNQSVTAIGEACGYNSNTVFNRAYSRFYGISPAETRRRAETGEE